MVPLTIFQKKQHLSFHWNKNYTKMLRNGNFRRTWMFNSSYPALGLSYCWGNNVKKTCFVGFSTFGPKLCLRMLQNAILSLETEERTHPNKPQTKGFALKHHQNVSKQFFWKVKILHFFQNFKFQKWEFSFSFCAENGSWKSKHNEFCQKIAIW